MTQSTEEVYFDKLTDGEVYVLSEMKSVTAGGTHNIHIENPSTSTKEIVLYETTVTSDGPFHAYIHDEFDNITPGTIIDVHSSKGGESGTDIAPFTAYQDSTHTPTNAHAHAVVGSAGGGNNALGGQSASPPEVLSPDTDTVLHTENTGSSEYEIAILLVVFTVSNGRT